MVNSQLFPPTWGVPPEAQTRDYRVLPGGYGHGSSTMAKWIAEKMEADAKAGQVNFPPAWGSPPDTQTCDILDLPLGYGTVRCCFASEEGATNAAPLRAPSGAALFARGVVRLTHPPLVPICALLSFQGLGHAGCVDPGEIQRARRLLGPRAQRRMTTEGWPTGEQSAALAWQRYTVSFGSHDNKNSTDDLHSQIARRAL